MSPRTQVFLYKLLWGAELIARPEYRHVIESYEAWAWRRGHLRTIRRLEEQGLIETLTRRRPDDPPAPDPDPAPGMAPPTRTAIHRIHRLTHAGRITALGGMDPELRWNRPWDGLWRMIHFDIPEEENSARARLRRALRDRGFGYLQNSLWISPFPLDAEIVELAAPGGDVEAVFSMAGRPAAGETDAAIVAGAWDFAQVNRLYEECLEVLENPPEPNFHSGRQAQAMIDWIRREHRAWQAVLKKDPFLPAALLPPGYLGRKVWELRTQLPGRVSFPRPPAPPAPAPHRASPPRLLARTHNPPPHRSPPSPPRPCSTLFRTEQLHAHLKSQHIRLIRKPPTRHTPKPTHHGAQLCSVRNNLMHTLSISESDRSKNTTS